MRRLKVCELVEDFDFYPRLQVDSQHVLYLSQALLAGCELPRILIDKKTKRIVDGFHRRRAYEKAYGADHQVEVDEKSYRTESELFLDAARLNAVHGKRMATADYVRVIQRAEDLKIEPSSVASALRLTVEKVGELKADRTAHDSHLTAVPLKRTINHMAGKVLNDGQLKANKGLSGMNQIFYANQLISLLENELIDRENAALLVRLKRLHELLEPLVLAASAD